MGDWVVQLDGSGKLFFGKTESLLLRLLTVLGHWSSFRQLRPISNAAGLCLHHQP